MRCVKAIIEFLIVYEIFQKKPNLYDFCFEILLTATLEKYYLVNFAEGTLYNYACADAFVLTAVTTMMEIH